MYSSFSARNSLRALGALIGAAVVALLGVGAAKALSTGTPVDALVYSIKTQYSATATGACAATRTVPAVIGVATPVDVGGTVLPDVVVTVVAVPGIGGAPEVLELLVTKIKLGQLRASVEVVIAPDSASPTRVAAGPDGCETGLPNVFSATVTAGDDALCVLATTSGATPALSVLGAKFDAVGATRTNATEVSARLSPVPTLVSAKIDIDGPQDYHALVKTSTKTDLKLTYADSSSEGTTKAVAGVSVFPGSLDLTFTEKQIAYKASAPMDKVDLFVESAAPGNWTSRMNLDLTAVPAAATIDRTTSTRMTFKTPTGADIAPTKIGAAVVDFALFDPNPALNLANTLPILTGLPDQYLVTRIDPNFTVAKTKVLGLSRADLDTGDPVLVDVEHTVGPFHVVADLVGTDTRHLDVNVLDLPRTAEVSYSPSTQAFTYTGSGVINELNAYVTSSAPFVRNAYKSRLRILSLPTGLSGQLDAGAKTFTAKVTGGGVIGSLEAQVTSGQFKALPEGQQGVLVEDRPDRFDPRYDAFVRVLGLEDATVSWGDEQLAKMTHLAGSFVMTVDTNTIDIDGVISELPHEAYVSFGKAVPTPDEPGSVPPGLPAGTGIFDQVGDPPRSPDPAKGRSFVYRGSAPISQVVFHVTSNQPLFDDATDAHLSLIGLPREVTVTMYSDVRQAVVATRYGSVGSIGIELCSAGACDPGASGPPSRSDLPPPPDGIWVDDLAESYHAKVRIAQLSRLDLSWDAVVGVRLLHTARPFDIELAEDRTAGEFGEIDYLLTTKVKIDAVPADAKLSYDTRSQNVTYRGSSPIGLIDATRKIHDGVDSRTGATIDSPAYIVGRSTWAHLVIDGLPTVVDLTFQFGASGQKLVADAGTASISHVSLDLVSDESLLTKAGVKENLILHGRDGLMLWDLKDTSAAASPILDPYILLVRATDLQRISYTNAPHDLGNGVSNDIAVDVARTGSGTDLYVEVRGVNKSKTAKYLGDFANPFQYEGLHIWYNGAPSRLGFTVSSVRAADDTSQMWINTYGNSVGGELRVDTDLGAIVDLRGKVRKLPIGTAINPGLKACISTNSLNCLPSPYNEIHGDTQPLSATVDVASPIELVLHVVAAGEDTLLGFGTKMQVDIGYPEYDPAHPDAANHYDPATIEHRLRIGTEPDTTGQNSTVVYLDTDYGTVSADVRIFDDADLSTEINVPPGTVAKDRYVEVENEGVAGQRNTGFLACPSGFNAHAYALSEFHARFNLNDDVCTEPIMTSISPSSVPADGLPHVISVHGWGFAKATLYRPGDGHFIPGTYLEGTHLCFGTLVCLDSLSPNDTITRTPFLMETTVTIPVGTAPGTVVTSVGANTDFVRSVSSPGSCNCTFTITAPKNAP